jgi:hypothetical protein
MQYIIIRW